VSVRPILHWPDPRLAQVCAPLGDAPAEALVADLFDTMYAAPGRGLAAPQIGVLARVFVMDCGWKEGTKTPRACIDPEIVWTSDEVAVTGEGCLSIPGVTAEVTRPAAITLRYRTLTGETVEERLTGFEAICAQHEFDHLNGIVTFDRLTPKARAEAEAAYAP